VYQTSGELAEAPQGVGESVPGVEGVAQTVVPHAAGEPALTAMALAQLSLAGGVALELMFIRKVPVPPK